MSMREHRFLPRLCLCLGLALAGCTPSESEWTQTEAPKQLRVDYVRLKHVASFAPGSAELAGGEAQKLAQFLDASDISPEDHVFLEPGSDDRLTALRIGRLAREMDKRGIGAVTLPAGTTPANAMTVVVERYVVTPPDCPNWTSPPYGDHSNQPPSNWGCADATNLSLMVADPHDLVLGRKLGAVEGDPAIAAVGRYRADKLKPLYGTTPSGDTFSSGSLGAPSGGGGSGGTGGGGGQ